MRMTLNLQFLYFLKKALFSRNVLVLFCVIAFLFSFQSSAQERTKPTDSSSVWTTVKYDANASYRSMKHAVTRPLQWKGEDFAKFGGLIAGTAIISLSDNQTSNFFTQQQNTYPRFLDDYGFYYAKPVNFLIASASIYGFGLVTKNEQIRKTGVLIISSSVVAGYSQILARTAVGRARPHSGFGKYAFEPFAGTQDYFSFPSGHTVLAVTMAHSIAKQFENVWVKSGIYALATLPPLSRLINGEHWLSDVAFGAAYGIIVVDCMDRFLFNTDTYNYKNKEKKITWNFSFGANQIGVVGTF
ncbi:PAP2 family protein [unidentified eubacterium SCB49]|nr:PAP2 family protein [unidentified eubacterium SCB49]